jgi:chromosome segregation ATPase
MLSESVAVPTEAGRRVIPSAPQDSSSGKVKIVDPNHRAPDMRLLDLEFENQILLNKLDKYHRAFAKGVDYVYKETPVNVQELPLNYNNKTNYVNLLQDRLVELTKDAEKSGKQELMERIRFLEIQNTDQKESLNLISVKYIKLKQKYLQLRRYRDQVNLILETSKAIRGAVGEFEKFGTINNKTLKQIDFQTFDLHIADFEEQKAEEAKNKPKKKDQGQDIEKAEAAYESKKKEKLISSLQEHVKALSAELDKANDAAKIKSAELAKEFKAKMDEEQKKMQSSIDEVVYKYTMRGKQLEEDMENLKQKSKAEVDNLNEKLKVETEQKENFKNALTLKEIDFDSINRKYNELKLKVMKDQERFKKIMADQKISMSKIMGSAIKMSAVSKSVLQQMDGFERKKNEAGQDVVELDADTLRQLKNDLQNMDELSTRVDQLNEVKAQLEKENADLEKEIEEMQKKIDDGMNEVETLKIAVNTKEQELKSANQKAKILADETEKLKIRASEAEAKVEVLDKELKDLKHLVSDLQTENANLKETVHKNSILIATLQEKIPILEEKLEVSQKAFAEEQKKVEQHTKTIEEDTEKIKMLEKTIANMKTIIEENKVMRQKMEETKKSFEEQKEKFRRNEKNYNDMAREILAIKNQNSQFEDRLQKTKEKYKAKIAVLKSVQKSDNVLFLEKMITEKDEKLSILNESVVQKDLELKTAKERLDNVNLKLNERNDEQLKLVQEVSELSKYKYIFDEIKRGVSDYLTMKNENVALSKKNQELRDEIEKYQDQAIDYRKKIDELTVELAKNDQQFEIRKLTKKLQEKEHELSEMEYQKNKLENEHLTLTKLNTEMSEDLAVKNKMNERFEARVKEVEEMILGSRAKKPIQSYELQTANSTIDKLTQEKADLQFKISTLELLKNEQGSQIALLENKLQEMKMKFSMNLNLTALLETKDQQMFEMIVNTNKKQTEIDALKEKNSQLEAELNDLKSNFHDDHSIVAPPETDSVDNDETTLQTILSLRQKFKIPAKMYDTKSELLELYKKLDFLKNKRGGGNSNTNSYIRNSDFENMSNTDPNDRQRPEISTTKQQILDFETKFALAQKKEEEFNTKEEKFEEERKTTAIKLNALNGRLGENQALIQELKLTNDSLTSQLAEAKNKIANLAQQIIEKDKQNMKIVSTLNQVQLDNNSKNAIIKIEESKVIAANENARNLKLEVDRLTRECERLNEGSFAAVNNVLSELNTEREEVKKLREKLAMNHEIFDEVRRENKDLQSKFNSRIDEISRLKTTISNQNDRIDLLIRIQKLPSEAMKELKENTTLKLENDINLQQIADLSEKLKKLEKEIFTKNEKISELEKSLEAAKDEEKEAKRILEDGHEKYRELRKGIAAKNELITKLQNEILELTQSVDNQNEQIVLMKLEKGDLNDQIDYLKNQIDSAFARINSPASYCHVGTETDNISSENAYQDKLEEAKAAHQKEIREFQRKLKVRNDKIKNLTETLSTLSPASARKINILTLEENKIADQKEKERVLELENRVIDLEAKLAAHEDISGSFVNKVLEKTENDTYLQYVIEDLEKKCAALNTENEKLKFENSQNKEFLLKASFGRGITDKAPAEFPKLEELKAHIDAVSSENKNLNKLNIELGLRVKEVENELKIVLDARRLEAQELEEKQKKDLNKIFELEDLIERELIGNELFQEEMAYKKKEIENLKLELAERSSQVNDLKGQIDKIKIAENAVNIAQNRLMTEQEISAKFKNELLVAQAELSHFEQNLESEKAESSELRNELKQLKAVQLAEQNTKIESLEKETSDLRRLIGAQNKSLNKNAQNFVTKMNDLIKENIDLKRQLGEAEVASQEELRKSTFVQDLLKQSTIDPEEQVIISSTFKETSINELKESVNKLCQTQKLTPDEITWVKWSVAKLETFLDANHSNIDESGSGTKNFKKKKSENPFTDDDPIEEDPTAEQLAFEAQTLRDEIFALQTKHDAEREELNATIESLQNEIREYRNN